MSTTHFHDWHLDDEAETTLVIEFTFSPGYPETGPTYACGGTPAEPPEIEVVSAHRKEGGEDYPLSDDLAEKIMIWLSENFEDDWEPDYPDYDA
jgi:hypothetical protein